MKKTGNNVKRGIRRKYRNLILIVIALVVAVFVIMFLIQATRLSEIVRDTNNQQKEVISSFSEDTMEALISRRLDNIVEIECETVGNAFANSMYDVGMVADYATKVFADPESFPTRELKEPDASQNGKTSAQLISEEGVDLNSPKVQESVQNLSRLKDMMLSTFEFAYGDSLYVATTEGVALLVDQEAASRFDENGELIHVPLRDREWYKNALEGKSFTFTDVMEDAFTGKTLVTCSVPIYKDGEVVAVAAADLFLYGIEDFVNSSYENGEFICILDQNGQVILSPLEGGLLGKPTDGEGQDLREYTYMDFDQFVKSVYEGTADIYEQEIDGKSYYMSGMPIEAIGWVLLHAIDKSILTEPTVMTQDQIDLLMSAAVSSVNNEILRAIILIAVLLAVVAILVLFLAGKLSGRIVDPLENMTNRIVSIKGEDLLFPMEDTYRTGDEIEVLAGSFSDLSSRTLQYVDQVKTVTAEKERIGAELSMATAIQASQLPRLFPAFPEREEFKLHASMTPAKEVGGDFYDFYFVDQDHIALIVADVSGKGVPAALFMMISRVLIKSRLQNGESPGEALMHANDQLCENNEAGLFVTVWAAVIQISTGKGVAINAGHEHPALRKGNGPFELVVYEHSLAVAAFEGVPFEEHEFQLNSGDCIFVYTDGVPESQNPQGELFEMERMIEALNVDPTAEPEQLIENVKKGIEKFVDGAEQFDDTTMLCFRYDGVK